MTANQILRRALIVSGVLAASGAAVYFAVDRWLSAPPFDGPVSDRFQNGRFHNLDPTDKKGFIDFLRWQATAERGYWPPPLNAAPGPPPPARVEGNGLRVTYINHATVLLQLNGVNILTDPVWSERASPVTWAGPRRVRSPGLRFEDLPRIDLVLISHNHYDHMDLDTLRRLQDAYHPRILVALGNRAFLERKGIVDVIEFDWWQSLQLNDEVRIHSVPAKHFSGRGLSDRDRTLWCGYVLETRQAGNVYFAGDTAFGSHFEAIRDRFSPIRLALFPIGAFLPRWFMAPVHISPEEAVKAQQLLQPKTSVPIHFGTFPLGDDGEMEAVTELKQALEKAGESEGSFRVLDFGEGLDVPK
jgi:L-ascorbate metabolism protein UlaG (beta-lactamase superfamily)